MRAAAAVAIAFLLILSCEGWAQERPGPGAQSPSAPLHREIAEIRVDGVVRVEEEAVRVRLGSRPGEVIDETKVHKDLRRIYDMGFFEQVEAHLLEEDGRWVVAFRVKERPIIKTIRFEGNKRVGKEDLTEVVNVYPRTILNPVKIRRGIEEIKKKYEERGYLDADVSYRTDQVGQGEVELVFVVHENKAVRIAEVAFEGNESFRDKQLRGVMATRKRSWLSRFLRTGSLDNEVLKTDMERLTAFYYDHGYIDVRVDEPRVARREDGIHVTVRIDEGEQFTVGEIAFGEGAPGNPKVMRKLVSLREGEVFRASHLREDVMKLTGYFSDLGYAFVNIEPDTGIRPKDKAVDLTFRVDAGPEVFIDRVEITGNTKTRDKVIRREVRIPERGRFSATGLQSSRDMVLRLGLFEGVDVTTQRGRREDRLDVLVDVKEGQTGAFSLGAGFNSSTSVVGSASLREGNFMGKGQRVTIGGSLGTIFRNTQFSFQDPYFFDTYLTAGFDLFDWRFQFEDFDRSGTGGGVNLFYPLHALGVRSLWRLDARDVRIGLGYQFERAEISDFDFFTPEAILSEAGKETTSSITPTIVRNTLNHPFDPTRGSLQQFSVGYGGLGGSTDFIKAETEARWFFPVYRSQTGGDVTLMTGGFLGYGFGDKDFSDDSGRQILEGDLPLFERYFPGGIDSIRGFAERSLGPRESVCADEGRLERRSCSDEGAVVVDSDPIGGSIQLVSNNEVIFPLLQPLGLRGVVFFDAGNAFTREQGLDLGMVRYSAGAGIRWRSPFGPIRIELARALNPGPDERTSNVHFSFGGFGGINQGSGRPGVPF